MGNLAVTSICLHVALGSSFEDRVNARYDEVGTKRGSLHGNRYLYEDLVNSDIFQEMYPDTGDRKRAARMFGNMIVKKNMRVPKWKLWNSPETQDKIAGWAKLTGDQWGRMKTFLHHTRLGGGYRRRRLLSELLA